MKPFLLLAVVFVFVIYSCKKDGDDPSPPNPPAPVTKYILSSFRSVQPGYDMTCRFDFGPNKKPAAMRVYKNGALTIDSTLYFYNDKGQLIKSLNYGDVLGPTRPRDIRKYFYDGAGRLIADTAYDESGFYTYYWNYNYTYNNEGSLIKHGSSTSWYRRYEYDTGNNPVKTYMKPYDRNTEALEYEFKKFDDKVGFLRYDTLMRIILMQYYAGSYNEEVPDCAFHNNALQYLRHPYPLPGGETWVRDFRQVLEYNADGYPIKAIILQAKVSGNGADTIRTTYFEYRKLE
jgi:hypothetical protein